MKKLPHFDLYLIPSDMKPEDMEIKIAQFPSLRQTETVEEPIEEDAEAAEEPEKEADEDEAEVEEEEEDKDKPKTKKVGSCKVDMDKIIVMNI